MRLHSVRLRNFRGVDDRTVTFSPDGATIVEGSNEIGKTSMTQALQMVIDLPASSKHRDVRSAQPEGRDVGPEVEVSLSAGPYDLKYRKRWIRQPETSLTLTSPSPMSVTGQEAHDRVREILGETLDEDLWKALRIDQGTGLAMPAFDMPSMGRALDRAAGGEQAADRDETLWERIGEEYLTYWTRTGRPGKELSALEDGEQAARAKAEELEEQIAAVEADAAQMERLAADRERLSVTQAESKLLEDELRGQWEDAQKLVGEVERLKALAEAAASERDRVATEQQRRREMIDLLSTREGALSDLVEEAERAAPALEAATRVSAETRAEVETAKQDLGRAEDKQRLAGNDREHLRRQIELDQLRERHERYEAAAETLRKAEALLEESSVDDDMAAEIEEAHLEYERARAAAASGAASVEATALSQVRVNIDGDGLDLDAGQSQRSMVDDELTLEVPGLIRLRVSAGPDSRDLAEQRIRTHRIYRDLCETAGVSTPAGARKAAEQRKDAERDRKEALRAIERDLRDLTPEVLIDKIRGHTERITAYSGERPQDPPMPPDFEEAKRLAYAAETVVEDSKAQFGTLETAARQAADALAEAQAGEGVLTARINDARRDREAAAASLAAARNEKSDAELTAELAAAQMRANEAAEAHRKGKDALESADPESLEFRLQNAADSRKRASEELEANSEEQSRLRVKLELQGEKGFQTLHDEARSQLDHAEREHRLFRGRAEAARLLRDTFERRRSQARQRYMDPFKASIDQLGRLAFGNTFSVELGEDLSIQRRTLEGVTLDFGQLSTGAREQLGVISRLACAAIISPDDGGAPVVIDDALGWSDPQRLRGMNDVIAKAAGQCQVIVLTCTPGRYSGVGRARVINLDS